MEQPRLRVVEWLSSTPVIAVCTACSKEFRVPMKALSRTTDAEEYLQQQYDRHQCKDASRTKDSMTATG